MYTYANDRVVRIDETTANGDRTIELDYNDDDSVHTVTSTAGGRERVETFAYNQDGSVASMAAVENDV